MPPCSPFREEQMQTKAERQAKDTARQALRYKTDPKYRNMKRRASRENYLKKSRKELNQYTNKQRSKIKKEVLTHYGKNEKLLCCWRSCTVHDLDMLSLDHVKDDGAEHRRKEKGSRISFCGKEIYYWVKRNKYPKGFQTLCMNHQYKKQRIKNRKS